MAKFLKNNPLNNPSPFSDILNTIGNVGGAAFIANAIKEHTRAIVALDYYKRNLTPMIQFDKMDELRRESWVHADLFLDAGKKSTTPTENDQAA